MTVWSSERQIHDIQKNERECKGSAGTRGVKNGKLPLVGNTGRKPLSFTKTKDANGCKKKIR